MKQLHFEKWHGTGNDFVVCSEQRTLAFTPDIPALAKKVCDRHFGIGSDGLILIGKSTSADFRQRMWNPDGSESEMCANGLRCVAAHILGHGLVDSSENLKIETSKRIVELSFEEPEAWASDDFWVRVGMGMPVLDRSRIPISGAGESPVIEEELSIPGFNTKIKFTAINFGNPHAVIFVDDVDAVPLEKWGPAIENHLDLFPERINVEFVQVISETHVKMRVWERGAGITLSCGSGTAAIQAACHLTEKTSDKLRVDVPGGSLMTEFIENEGVYLSGPAVRTFTGEWYK